MNEINDFQGQCNNLRSNLDSSKYKYYKARDHLHILIRQLYLPKKIFRSAGSQNPPWFRGGGQLTFFHLTLGQFLKINGYNMDKVAKSAPFIILGVKMKIGVCPSKSSNYNLLSLNPFTLLIFFQKPYKLILKYSLVAMLQGNIWSDAASLRALLTFRK